MNYGSPSAFRAALEAKLLARSRQEGIDLQRLRRLVLFERVLARLESFAPGRCVLKGGVALELRFPNTARATKDLDLALREIEQGAVEVRDTLVGALNLDTEGDWFEFLVSEPNELSAVEAGRVGWRFALEALLDGRQFGTFHLDVVLRDQEVAPTDRVRLPGSLVFAGLDAIEVEVVNEVQLFAEKLHALTRTYPGERPSSRVKDLVDLVMLIEGGLKASNETLRATEHVFRARDTHALPLAPLVAPSSWAGRYEALLPSSGISARTFPEAVEVLNTFWSSTRANADEED
jgi:predicted nucleotidyltransferase component of viral defense system